MQFDLSTARGRYMARKAGLEVPKRQPGPPTIDPWAYLSRAPSGCWLWTGRVNRDGYGVYSRAGKSRRAHREIYEQVRGEIPHGCILMHSCDIPNCCNPWHLTPGSRADNRADAVAKNRHAKGEAQGASKLNEAQIREIRGRYIPRITRQKDLAAEYGVSRDLIHKIISRKYWRHVS